MQLYRVHKTQMENSGNPPYHNMVDELKEKLRISEESRRSLQQKFDAMMQTYKIKEQARYNALRKRYGAFLEEDQRRQQRNENLLQMLERIDNRSASLAARTERLGLLRKHYEQYLGQIYPSWKTPSHRMLPVKIRDFHEEEVSGYGTHTGSSAYDRYEEPRMPPMSTPRANTHLYKTDNILPDKYRIPRIDFDMPSISVTRPDEERTCLVPVGRYESKMPEIRSITRDKTLLEVDRTSRELDRSSRELDRSSRELDRSPRVLDRNLRDIDRSSREVERGPREVERGPREVERGPREVERGPREVDRSPREAYLNQLEFEVDQNTSGDLLNMSLSDDGVSSLTRSETDVARHQHWETLRQAYINRQQPGYREIERTSADEDPQEMGWSRQQENIPKAYDYTPTVNEHAPQEPTEQVSVERESFRDKIRRLKVMIQENKELERSIEVPEKDQRDNTWERKPNEADNRSQQRARRQSIVDSPGLANQQTSANVYPQDDRAFAGNTNGGRGNEERGMPEGTLRRKMSIMPDQIVTGDSMVTPDNQRTDFQRGQGADVRAPYNPEQILRENENRLPTEPQQMRQNEHVREKRSSEEKQFYQEEMNKQPSIDAHYDKEKLNQPGEFNYSEEQSNHNQTQKDINSNDQSKEIPDNFNESRIHENANSQNQYAPVNAGQNQYPYEGQDPQHGNAEQYDKSATNEQYYQEGENQQGQGFYNDPNQNYDAQAQGYDYNQGDAQPDYQYQPSQPDNNYYSEQQNQRDGDQEQKNYPASNEQEYYQDKPYYDQQDQSNAQYDPNQQYSQQYSNQYDNQQPQYNDGQQQQYGDGQQQPYDDSQQQPYNDGQPYGGGQQQQYDDSQQQPYGDNTQQQYGDGEQQQYGGWQQNSDQQGPLPVNPQEQYQYYGQQNQGEVYGYESQNQGGNEYDYSQQSPDPNYVQGGGNPQGETGSADRDSAQGNQPREDTSSKYYQDASEESTQESDRSHGMQLGRNLESPSQRSIDRYRTMLGVDPNSDPAYSEVDEIEDEMAAVLASGTENARIPAANNVQPTETTIPNQNLPKPLEMNPKQLHDDSSDFDYSSGP